MHKPNQVVLVLKHYQSATKKTEEKTKKWKSNVSADFWIQTGFNHGLLHERPVFDLIILHDLHPIQTLSPFILCHVVIGVISQIAGV